MKLDGVDLSGPNVVTLVLPRNGNNVVFKAQAVLNFDIFHNLAPKPTPKIVTKAGGKKEQLINHPDYISALDNWAGLKTSWLVLESLKATPSLTWDTVDPNNPSTWNNYKDELVAAKFSDREIQLIVQAVFQANSLDDDALKEALDSFLAGQAQE